LHRGFLTNEEYENIFEEFGIFLTPTRWDSHGVGRDEAMSCGLVPATNRISAIPEFVNRGCSILAEPEDHIGLANGIEELVNDPELFIRKSTKAAKRVRRQTSHDVTIPKEIVLFTREN
jgi:glycosyltransferase involved in cell wall biosynthesis